MAAILSLEPSAPVIDSSSAALPDDPFDESTPKMDNRKTSHRFSAFDTQLFSSYQPTASPATAKRALEAHITETDKRLEEASKLGTALVQQRQSLAEKLKEVETHLDGQEMTPELRQQLAEVEKEYHELGRESARAFLAHKSRVASGDGETPARSASPTKFSSQAMDSPSKMSVPSRKQRNQQTSRVGDIEFVTQISTSLLSQVRQLQAVLAERDETLKTMNSEKSKIEMDNEGLLARLKTLDESEQKFKDENWSLETQTHELMAAAKDSANKEQKLQQALALVTSQKNAAQRELDDVKQAHGKATDDLAASKKTHDSEASGLRKNALALESEREVLQKKVDELTSQNQELARVMAGRFRQTDDAPIPQLDMEPQEFFLDNTDTDHSPPPSPTKGAARNSMLESETLKSSLNHAHRMIQNLKSNIHREKTEKLELKRMLQESRDELEQRRADPNGLSKRAKTKSQQDLNKKAARGGQLGAGRQPQTSVEMDDPEWIDHVDESPRPGYMRSATADTSTDAYHTAAETDDAFMTADEQATETDAFQTGNEGHAGDSSDELTETETPSASGVRSQGKRNTQLPYPNIKRESFISTASTSDEEDLPGTRTPVQGSFRGRGKNGKSVRKSRAVDEDFNSSPATMRDSPASFVGAGNGQSLFAELEDLENASDENLTGTPGTINSTPAKRPNSAFLSSPSKLRDQSIHGTPSKEAMIDSSMNTDAWQPESERSGRPLTAFIAAATAGLGLPAVMQTSTPTKNTVDSGTQPSRNNTPVQHDRAVQPNTPLITMTDATTQHSNYTTPLIPNKSVVDSTGTTPSKIGSSQRPKALGFSIITTTDLKPSARPVTPANFVNIEEPRPSSSLRTESAASEVTGIATGGVIGSVIGWAMGKKQDVPEENATDTPTKRQSRIPTPQPKQPFREISPNIRRGSPSPAPKAPLPIPMIDTGAQTTLSSHQIDNILLARLGRQAQSPIASPVVPSGGAADSSSSKVETPTKPGSSNGPTYSFTPKEISYPPRSPRRPGSAHSTRSTVKEAPPLPADHRQAIAAAQTGPSVDVADLRPDSSMGPPTMTAAGYRAAQKKAQRSGEPHTPASISSNTPRARYSAARSMRSRRSSVSSFESELDARFNIRTDSLPMGSFEGGTDPRMIQAITQTMIGEFLWKYTRKAGRGEMSAKRHRRFFWVHPYTRTLYWSDQDPSTAGRVQMKAKSVAIEAVRVVADDNPMPPGLHRKSLVVITPGRDIKFTATTGQRHETWFNALSYLLLRSTEGQKPDSNALTAEDVAEFNPSYSRAGGSRISLSSYNSRTNTTRRSLASLRGVSPNQSISSRRALGAPNAANSSRPMQNNNHASVGSRISNLWRPTRSSTMNSIGEKPAQEQQQTGSIYNASVVNDSAEDVRQVLEKQDHDADRLENVRACCDGKHDVGSLNRHSTLGRRSGHKH